MSDLSDEQESVPHYGAVEAVSSALGDLADLDELPLSEHVTRFDAAHSALTVALTSIDQV